MGIKDGLHQRQESGEDAFSGLKEGARAIVPPGATAYGSEGSIWNGMIISYQ